jgi:hypothetical protein
VKAVAPALGLIVVTLWGSPSVPRNGIQPRPGAKVMFYDPGDLGVLPADQPAGVLRPVRYVDRALHCGIHYWLQTVDGTRMTERMARSATGPFTVHLRNNVGSGFLTVWNVSTERQLTPLDPDPRINGGGRWSGFQMSDAVYDVPGTFAFSNDDSATRLIIVWARSQTEVAASAAHARKRLIDMPAWMPIVSETDDATPGEIGTYVMNRTDAGVAAEILFRR